MHKKLRKSRTDKMFDGVLGGMANYLNVDSTVLRLIFIVFLIFTAILPLMIFYLVAMFIVPDE